MISTRFCFITEIDNLEDAEKALEVAKSELLSALRDLIYKIEGSMNRVNFYRNRIVEINKIMECF